VLGLRNLVRIVVSTALCVALAASAVLPVPQDLPAIAMEQAVLYRLEVALGVFYGCLLLATPAYSGLAMGRLPIEISTRGAKFAEEADQSADITKAALERFERVSDLHENELVAIHLDIERLDAMMDRDTTQPEVDSEA
jgi:type III secretory pathway component EscT